MKVVIVGGNAAGLKTAARLRRLDPKAEIVVLEQGRVISYAGCGLPYFLSGDVDSFDNLVETAWGEIKDSGFFREAKDLDVRTGVRVLSIDRDGGAVKVEQSSGGDHEEIAYDYLVLATGSNPHTLGIPGCDVDGVGCFTRPEEAIELRKELETGQIGKVIIIGGGYIGLELCEAFGALWGAEAVLLERENHLLPVTLDAETARLVRTQLEEQGVTVRCGVNIVAMEKGANGPSVRLEDGETIGADRIIMAAGVRPNVELARTAGLEIGPRGGVLVDDRGATSDPRIFAAGDCVEIPGRHGTHLLPLGSVANRQGRVVANVIMGRDDRMPELHGSAVIKVFDLTVGVCGQTAEKLKHEGTPFEEYWGSFTDAAHYYPENKDVHIKIVREAGGRLAGIQVIGKGEVVRWVDAFAQVLDLGDGDPTALRRFEHAYAPPYATAMDPLHHLGAMIEAGPEMQLPPDALLDGGDPSWIVVNLLAPEESRGWSRPEIKGNWVDIPFRELRRKAADLPRENVVLLCARGPRSYEGAVILRSLGIHARYVAGGVTFR